GLGPGGSCWPFLGSIWFLGRQSAPMIGAKAAKNRAESKHPFLNPKNQDGMTRDSIRRLH
ncbi:hypothetical protein, partial [Ralstonia solanacearum]|uniref:hypothetical protein n=1 Tax=Ralstonia solanacearum TaxID=305 RepID=UPI001FD7EA6A